MDASCSTEMSGVKRTASTRIRKYLYKRCKHCNEDVSKTTYYRHKSLYKEYFQESDQDGDDDSVPCDGNNTGAESSDLGGTEFSSDNPDPDIFDANVTSSRYLYS